MLVDRATRAFIPVFAALAPQAKWSYFFNPFRPSYSAGRNHLPMCADENVTSITDGFPDTLDHSFCLWSTSRDTCMGSSSDMVLLGRTLQP